MDHGFGSLSRGDHEFNWNGKGTSGRLSGQGIYHAVIIIDGEMAFSDKIIKAR